MWLKWFFNNIDFIDFCAFPKLWYYTFNVADSFVCVGAGLMFVYLLRDVIREIKAQRAVKAAQDNAVQDNAAQETAEPCEDAAEEKDAE